MACINLLLRIALVGYNGILMRWPHVLDIGSAELLVLFIMSTVIESSSMKQETQKKVLHKQKRRYNCGFTIVLLTQNGHTHPYWKNIYQGLISIQCFYSIDRSLARRQTEQ